MTRQNANGVDPNRNGDLNWDAYKGVDSDKNGTYGPGDYDWKGVAPLSEPEAQTYKRICQSARFIAFLDVHGNPSGTGGNKEIG